VSNIGIGAWYPWICDEGLFPFTQTSWSGDGWRYFFLSCYPWSYGPSFISRNSEMVSPGTGLWAIFTSFCLEGRLQLGLKVTHCQFLQSGQSFWCLTRQKLHCYTATPLSGQLLPQQDGAIRFWVLFSVPEVQFWDPPPALFGVVGLLPNPRSQSMLLVLPLFTESLGFCPTPVLWSKFSIPAHSCCWY
jgi:hypothetical protein